MRRLLSSFFTTIALSSSAWSAEVETCHQFATSDTTRLRCYDHATGFASKAKPSDDAIKTTPEIVEEEHSTKSKWLVRKEVSEIDDSTNVFLSLTSEDNISGRFGGPGPMRMYIACRENTTSLWIIFNGHHMSDYQYGTVTYRLDKTPARKKNMRESTDNQALGLWRGGSSIPFIKSMFGHKRMLIKATPYGENAVQATFEIAGLEQDISALRKACHW
jgi:type VI secretion system protein VasI